MAIPNTYLISLQFLGFRYSGWQKQPGQKTVEGMLHKTLRFILPGRKFKILGAGRTDARVSALQAAFQCFIEGDPLPDPDGFLDQLNLNLPPDIRALTIQQCGAGFNILRDIREKEYRYFFASGPKLHPFCAPFMAGFPGSLDIAAMTNAAPLFEGTHDFRAYTTKGSKGKRIVRTITSCSIGKNDILQANFFPEESYVLRVCGQGFMRYQVRMIMGALIGLGRNELGLADLMASLEPGNDTLLSYVAPGSGLLLHKLDFTE